MTAYPVEELQKERLQARLQYAMIEALTKQGLLTEAQRRELCRILNCETARFTKGRCDEKEA